jgi:hypothetical protein
MTITSLFSLRIAELVISGGLSKSRTFTHSLLKLVFIDFLFSQVNEFLSFLKNFVEARLIPF